ncbi:MAG TPA: PRTRC system protein E [Nevskia sp.]|nr:PRTRC system protein E [Nevskia sp.]
MLLKTIAQFMRAGEGVTFKLIRHGDGVRLLITPQLAPEDEKASVQAKQIRALLAKPVLINSTVETLDTDAQAALDQVAAARTDIAASYEDLVGDMRAGAKTAADLAAGKAKGKPAKPPAKAAAPAADAPDDDEEKEATPEAEPAAAAPVVNLFEDDR